jgi:hypothetical protein
MRLQMNSQSNRVGGGIAPPASHTTDERGGGSPFRLQFTHQQPAARYQDRSVTSA